jgi:hypothetical protein
MREGDSSGPAEHSHALHTITSLPLDPQFPLFQQYPAMKLGVRASVRYYASLLTRLAETVIGSAPDETQWVVTAPPLYAIPAGANLLAGEVFRALSETAPGRLSIRSVDLRYALPNPQKAQDVLPAGDYSNSGIADRIRNRKELHEGEWAPRPDAADFRGRAVLVINDINVTGTQQQFLQQTLETVNPASIHWLYIIQVDPALGRSSPELEYSLNHLNLETFDDFVEVVARADIDYTSRCVARLFGYSESELASLVRSIDESRRRKLYQLAAGEGAYTGEQSKAKLALLREGVRSDSVTRDRA